jgi:hypothetical protein
MTASNTPRALVNVYAAGGGGVNIVADMEGLRNQTDIGFASMLPCYIDTSRSNLHNKKLPEEAIYLFSDIDGSGKVRSANYEVISKNVLGILQKFKPTMFNIVVHTASGGSGSVIGPVLVSELKARGENVVVVVVGSTDTRIEIENTIKTLKSYEGIANVRNSPVVMHYVENTRDKSRFEVNKQVKYAITMLLGLFSGQNEELDTSDLKNWLEYLKFSGGPAQLSSLNFVMDQQELDKVGTVVSVATLALQDMNTRLGSTPAYQCVGYAPAAWRVGTPGSLQMISEAPLHFTISGDFVQRASNALTTTLKEVDSAFASQITRTSILSKDDKATATGLVL